MEHCPDIKRGDFTQFFEVYGKHIEGRKYEINGFFTVVLLDPQFVKLDGQTVKKFPETPTNCLRENYAFTSGNILVLNHTHFADILEVDDHRVDGQSTYYFESLSNLRHHNFSAENIDKIRDCFDKQKLEFCTYNGTHVIEGPRRATYERRFTLYQVNNTHNCFNIPWDIENASDKPISFAPLFKLPFLNSDSPLIERFRPKPKPKPVLKLRVVEVPIINTTEYIPETTTNTTELLRSPVASGAGLGTLMPFLMFVGLLLIF
ncbi:unnamed protein product [Bursaphelenchus okinawaensis]|uniref:Uncharacterized protein n=1 Tax=Bursaphelenchus okinawaensis TaxID=465554 RepID=A0A811JQB0_9BILA|nr:unnamed protein product [Bursaphelenchus okinawaensis]CAG9076944.1 unnamed protein product [Bursaphelenchus okinawaensis]